MASKTCKIIADLRKDNAWSQPELACKSYVPRELISKYERGEAVHSFDSAKKIAYTFEVSLPNLGVEGYMRLFNERT
jgi:transcriptional regulator with XRE-family HTH domain